ncbi:motile sperm domain-containing protein 2-like isoform X1 [Rhynchophorus ferrugineus]|uniref:motile sperm domain-containing protein 2-like isoform X1 n=1 Tax=Rhynchophorus ferrugineus TaxID=354439 RepID=UPI003FCC5EFB
MSVKDVPQSLVDELRTVFLEELEAKGTDTIHPKDLERVKRSDHWLQRFLAHQKQSVPKASKMMFTSLLWRKEFKVNDINENNIKMDLIIKGCFFTYGKDIMGSTLLVFRGKLYKGSINQDELRKCVIYWMERAERLTEGEPITLFFDMDGCGLSNIDMDLMKYLIGLFKEYYPFFLNLIIIFEMPWILSAAFKVIKSWLPEEAIEKIKFVTKKDINTVVPSEDILKSWGGNNPYVFNFIPEKKPAVESNNIYSKKVHFSESSSKGDTQLPPEPQEDGPVKVHPPRAITFVREGNGLVGTLRLQNPNDQHVVYKLKTTSPGKFLVEPRAGVLRPGTDNTVKVTLQQGFQLDGSAKDKFLVISCVVDNEEAATLGSSFRLPPFWSDRKVYQNVIRCVQIVETTKNGKVVGDTLSDSEESTQLSKLLSSLDEVQESQKELARLINRNQKIQLFGLIITAVLVAMMFAFFNKSFRKLSSKEPYCLNANGLEN